MNVAAFLSYTLLNVFTPGPNNIMAMSSAGKFGFKQSIRFCLGVFFGFFLVNTLGALFSSLMYQLIPKIEPVLMVAGAAYILYLAWVVWRDKPKRDKQGREHVIGLFSGIALQFINVKGIIFAITVFSTFILPNYREWPVLLAFALFLSVLSLISTLSWAGFGALFDKLFGRYKKVLNLVMALLLVYCAVSLLLS